MPKKDFLIDERKKQIVTYGFLTILISSVLVSYGLSLLAFDSQIQDQGMFASAYANPPSGGGSSGGGSTVPLLR